jgi:hypothetical protein
MSEMEWNEWSEMDWNLQVMKRAVKDDEAPEFEQQHDDEAPEFEQQPTFQQKRAEKVCVVLVCCCHVADVDVKRME